MHLEIFGNKKEIYFSKVSPLVILCRQFFFSKYSVFECNKDISGPLRDAEYISDQYQIEDTPNIQVIRPSRPNARLRSTPAPTYSWKDVLKEAIGATHDIIAIVPVSSVSPTVILTAFQQPF